MIITFFEQSAFLVEYDGDILAIDFGNYSSEASLQAAVDAAPVASLVTHIHPDHLSEPNLQAIGAPVYAIGQVERELSESGLEVFSHAAGETVAIEDTEFAVEYVAADHGPNVRQVNLENVGFCIRAGGRAIWYMGDVFKGGQVPSASYDAILIPVGNKGYTFDPEMAAAYLKEIGWTGITVPIHYSGSGMDPESGNQFAALAAACDARVLKPGESLEI